MGVEFNGAEAVILTLGHRGMILADGEFDHLPARNHVEIVDPTGAGDTVIAVATLARLAGASWKQAAELANHAAALKVARRGAVGPTAEELREAIVGG